MQTPSNASGSGTSASGSCEPAVIDSLKKYGDHAKAAYILYEEFCNLQSKGLHELFEEDSRSWLGLKGYTVVEKLMAYPGRAGVFTVPTPITQEGLVGLAAVEKPSFIGYIAEGTGQDGVPELVIAFRGTSTRADWETNLLGAVASKGLFHDSTGLVHRGFFNLINAAPDNAELTYPMKTIITVLARYKEDNGGKLPRIITTGHSLGGALAIVAAVCVAHYSEDYCRDSAGYTSRKLQTYTFAAPRIGDAKLAAYVSSTLQFTAVQVKNEPDVVPYAPPAGLRDMLSAVRKLIGMRPRRQCTAGEVGIAAAADAELEDDMSTDIERWETYQELLLEGVDSTATDDQQEKQLEQYIAEARKHYRAGVGDFSTAASENMFCKILYGMDLLTTVRTKWWDNPAPLNGLYILNVHKTGRWGGQNHSLEVYLDNLATGEFNTQ